MQKLIFTTAAVAITLAVFSATPAQARYLQTDPIGYEDDINLYAYVGNDPVNRIDFTGLRDIYIGGAGDKDGSRIVQNYAAIQAQKARDVQYFSWGEQQAIVEAASQALKNGEPLNIIGHSLGGRTAIVVANILADSGINIDNLVTIDPVGAPLFKTSDGANIGNWIDVTATPSSRDWSDFVASSGRAAMGTTDTSAANTRMNVDTNHDEFKVMMDTANVPTTIDQSYSINGCGTTFEVCK